MKKYLYPLIFPLAMFALIMSFAQAVNGEGQIVDPTLTPTMTLTCQYPIEREAGTTLRYCCDSAG